MNPAQSESALASSAPPAVAQDRWFRDEIHAHDPQLKAYLRNRFPAVRDVDDVVQESYLRVWRAAAHKPIVFARSYLYQVASRVALNFVRKQYNAPFVDRGELHTADIADDRQDARGAVLVRERFDILAKALLTLPARCREVVVMHKVQGLSQKEIAARLGISERTVETQVRAGVQRCHLYLRRHGMEPTDES